MNLGITNSLLCPLPYTEKSLKENVLKPLLEMAFKYLSANNLAIP